MNDINPSRTARANDAEADHQGASVQIASLEEDDSGADVPWAYTARVVSGSAAEAVEMLECNLGGSEELDAFNIEGDGSTIELLSFEHVDVGTVFKIDCSIARAKQDATEHAFLANEVERLTVRALLELFPCKPTYLRSYWWDRLHPDPAAPAQVDAAGRLIQVGQRCSYKSENTGKWIEGWVKGISDRTERTIAVRDMGRTCVFATGCRPSDVRVKPDEESATIVVDAAKELFLRKSAANDAIGMTQVGKDAGLHQLAASVLSAC